MSDLTTDKSLKPDKPLKLIAFFLTQFHPTPENDQWWGKGFTEWTNVTRAQPLYDGHYQPHRPMDLGFYDLRLRETRHEQIKMAKKYGIDGFCYHYYWFSGKRILNRPLDDMLADRQSNMPFCICWANENWTRRWDAADHEILIAQKYLPGDDLNFIKSLIPFFEDPRYICYEGAPFLIVYRPSHLPDPKKTVETWREYCRSIGIPKIYVCSALTHGNRDYLSDVFDGGVEFPPHNLSGSNLNCHIKFHQSFHGNVMEFKNIAESYLAHKYNSLNIFHTVFPSWDNTARTGNRALIVSNGTPANYEYWLAETIRKTSRQYGDQERFIFINAWNEWAEGCHLEPDQKYQKQFLEATLRAKESRSLKASFEDHELPECSLANRHAFLQDLSQVCIAHFNFRIERTRKFIRRFPALKAILLGLIGLLKRVNPTRLLRKSP